jgi:raffinose/stachyose/melibiose transport system permease protein
MVTTTTPPVLTAPRSTRDSLKRSRRRRVSTVGRGLWWFALPAIAAYVYIVIVPTVLGMLSSFTNWSFLNSDPDFVGFENFVRAFEGEAGPAAIRTLFIALVVVIGQNLLGLGLALLLHGAVVGRNVLRTIIFAPMVVSSLVVGYLFKYIFGPPGSGAVNALLAAMGLQQVDFLGNPTSALWIIIITVIWQFTGATMIIYLAGLQGVPQELDEAAALDGAGYWKRFWYVTRPLLAPAFTINLMIGLIGGLKIFDQIISLTNGGPGNQTQTIATLIYQIFSVFGDYGRAAALAVVLAVGVAILSLIQFRVLRRQERNS